LLSKFRKTYPSTPITVFLRTTVLDSAISNLGNIEIVQGDFQANLSDLENLVSKHSIIINAATSTDPVVNAAILRGISTRHKSGKKTILIHVTGAGNFVDEGKTGIYNEEIIAFNDSNPNHVRKINASMAPNGPSDEIILRAAANGEVNAYFVCPVGVYGSSKDHIAHSAGPTGAKYANTAGIWANWMMDNVTELGFSPYVGPGTSVFYTIHVDDVVSLILAVYAKAIEVGDNYQPKDVYQNFYLGADEKHQAKFLATSFAKAMARNGKVPNAEARSVSYDEAGITKR
jgi:hypothetical protein